MSKSKHFDAIAWAVTALTLVITLLFMNGAGLGLTVTARTMGYENRLFDNTRIHTIDIVMDDWDGFISTAVSEEYSAATVVIDGEIYKSIGIRGKGNTSLSNVASMGSERYSFKLEFDQYDSSSSYHGLDKLSLNNLIQDNTMMKDYLTYTMMNAFGVSAPLCSFAYLTVNGEDWGLYLAVEGVEDSFLTRNYGSDHGELYKPDSMDMGGGRGNGRDFNMDDFRGQLEEFMNEAETAESFSPSAIMGGGRGGMGMGGGRGSSDVKLQYIDESFDSYSNIWNNAKTDITDADKTRLIESLRRLSALEDIGSAVDIEQVVRYFVVHNYVCNGDSYTGSMIHNYYLYEKDGRLAMIPWDYNLAFGTFQSSDAQSTVNTPIDSPVDGGSTEDRPMLHWIFSDEAYTELYHEAMAEFLNSVDITGIIDSAYEMIAPYVERDPTKFCTYEEFELGVETLRQFCELRSESIAAQLESGETAETMNYADASSLTLSDMGSMGNTAGGAMPGRDNKNREDGFQMNQEDRTGGFPMPGGMPDGMPTDGTMPTMPDGMPTDGTMPDRGNMGGFQMPDMGGGQFAGTTTPAAESPAVSAELVWLGVSIGILILGLVIASLFKRR